MKNTTNLIGKTFKFRITDPFGKTWVEDDTVVLVDKNIALMSSGKAVYVHMLTNKIINI